MVSKSELQAEIVELKRQASKREFLMEVNERELATHRARESARMRTEHFEQQRKRREAEREDKRKRRQELADGMLRLKDVTEWAIVSDSDGKALELTVPLTSDIEPIVHGVLVKQDDRQATVNGQSATHSIVDEVNRIAWNRRVAAGDIIPHWFIAGRA